MLHIVDMDRMSPCLLVLCILCLHCTLAVNINHVNLTPNIFSSSFVFACLKPVKAVCRIYGVHFKEVEYNIQNLCFHCVN